MTCYVDVCMPAGIICHVACITEQSCSCSYYTPTKNGLLKSDKCQVENDINLSHKKCGNSKQYFVVISAIMKRSCLYICPQLEIQVEISYLSISPNDPMHLFLEGVLVNCWKSFGTFHLTCTGGRL